MTGTSEYNAWHGMKGRCLNHDNPNYPQYGARGITVCDRWKMSFQAFYNDMGDRPDGCSLDRKDPNGNYTPENCMWGTPKDQGTDRRSVKSYTLEGESHTLAEWAIRTGMLADTLYCRLRAGWSFKRRS